MHMRHVTRIIALSLCLLLGAVRAAEVVPNTIAEALAELDRLLSKEDQLAFAAKTEEAATIDAQLGLGMYIRNEWFRPGKSRLVGQLRDYGAKSFDDMSSMVLSAYWRHLNGKPIDLQRYGECYGRWWAEQERLIEQAKKKGSSSYESPQFSCVGA